MPAPPEMWEAFLDWCRNEIAERHKELAPYEGGSMRVRRGYGGDWVDITDARIAQIKREIASLESTMKRVSAYA